MLADIVRSIISMLHRAHFHIQSESSYSENYGQEIYGRAREFIAVLKNAFVLLTFARSAASDIFISALVVSIASFRIFIGSIDPGRDSSTMN